MASVCCWQIRTISENSPPAVTTGHLVLALPVFISLGPEDDFCWQLLPRCAILNNNSKTQFGFHFYFGVSMLSHSTKASVRFCIPF